MVLAMNKDIRKDVELVLLAERFPRYEKLLNGKEVAGFVLIPRSDGGCGVCYQYATGYYIPTETRRSKREWALQSYLQVLQHAGYAAQYVPEAGIMDTPGGTQYTQPYLICPPQLEQPFVWYEDVRNDAYNAAPEDTRSYIEALEAAVKEAVQYRLHPDKDHAKRLYDAVKLLNFLKEGE